jgi:hypothetical protein
VHFSIIQVPADDWSRGSGDVPSGDCDLPVALGIVAMDIARREDVRLPCCKQDEHGVAQLRLAIDVVQRFVADIASQEAGTAGGLRRPVGLRHLARIEALALSDAGRKVAKRYGVYVADAIDPAPVAHIEPFVRKKLPQLLKLMSAARRAELQRRD